MFTLPLSHSLGCSNNLKWTKLSFVGLWLEQKKSIWKKNWVDNVWIDKNWQFKQNVQIELIKIENSNKTFKLNWKKLKIQTKYSNWIEKNWKFKQDIQTELKKIENSNNIIKLNWKKFELQIYGSVWFEIIWSFSQYMTKLIWIELNVESLIWAALHQGRHRSAKKWLGISLSSFIRQALYQWCIMTLYLDLLVMMSFSLSHIVWIYFKDL